jgi:hypothetical protein
MEALEDVADLERNFRPTDDGHSKLSRYLTEILES